MMKILIADDSPSNRASLSRLLEKMGYAVIQVCDGGEAAELHEREPSDLVLIDVMRPLMDGYEAVWPSFGKAWIGRITATLSECAADFTADGMTAAAYSFATALWTDSLGRV